MKMFEKVKIKGQSLFEVVFAIAITAIILTGVLSLATTSVRNVDSSKNKSIASSEGRASIDWLRRQRDSDWDNLAGFSSFSGITYCLENPDEGLKLKEGDCLKIPGTNLTREVTLSFTDSEDVIQADVEVYWMDAQGLHIENLVTWFSNWANIESFYEAPPECSPQGSYCTENSDCCEPLYCISNVCWSLATE